MYAFVRVRIKGGKGSQIVYHCSVQIMDEVHVCTVYYLIHVTYCL